MGPEQLETVETVMERIPRNTFPDYSTPDFWEAVQMWRDWQTFGFPEAGGLNDQPCLWLDIMRLFNQWAHKMKVE
jgi:hypothetical protein